MSHFYDETQRAILLKIARDAIHEYLNSLSEIVPPPDDFLQVPAAAFVTLTIQDDLRGCIGATEASLPLGNQIVHCAIAAATRDPRFPPLTKDEYPLIHIEISVLSPFRLIQSVEEVEVGVHGIMVTYGFLRGLLLPQVAVEHGWDRDEFLQYSCRKAGLPADAWKMPGVKIEIFSAEIFGES